MTVFWTSDMGGTGKYVWLLLYGALTFWHKSKICSYWEGIMTMCQLLFLLVSFVCVIYRKSLLLRLRLFCNLFVKLSENYTSYKRNILRGLVWLLCTREVIITLFIDANSGGTESETKKEPYMQSPNFLKTLQVAPWKSALLRNM